MNLLTKNKYRALPHENDGRRNPRSPCRLPRAAQQATAGAAVQAARTVRSTQAQEKADKIFANAQEAIEAEKKAALADIKSQVAELSVEIAEKVTRKELSEKDAQLALIDKMLAEANI